VPLRSKAQAIVTSFLLACGQFVGKRCRMAVDQYGFHWTQQYPSDQVFYRSLGVRGEAVSKPKISS
jgi:hypothetical protein